MGSYHQVIRLDANGTQDWYFDTPLHSDGQSPYAPVINDGQSFGLQPDGKVVIGGSFTTVNSVERRYVARLNNDLATQALSVPEAGRVRWQRGGTSPEALAVSFELSTDGGGTWTPLGFGSRIMDGWDLTGLNLPSAGVIRARARTATGYGNGSSSLLETVRAFTLPAPPTATTLSAPRGRGAAQLFAAVNPNGTAGVMHFEYSADPSLAAAMVTDDRPFAAGTTEASFSQTIVVTAPFSPYYYRAVATNDHGTDKGDIVAFTSGGKGSDLWLYQHFGADWENVSLAADNDGDGVTNLAEYALGGDPLAPDSIAILPQVDVSGGYLHITFTRDPAHNDIKLIVQGSNNLYAWTDLARSSSGSGTLPLISGVTVTETTQGVLQRVQVTDSVAIGAVPARALRVKVSR
jgi:hypothetical protein